MKVRVHGMRVRTTERGQSRWFEITFRIEYDNGTLLIRGECSYPNWYEGNHTEHDAKRKVWSRIAHLLPLMADGLDGVEPDWDPVHAPEYVTEG